MNRIVVPLSLALAPLIGQAAPLPELPRGEAQFRAYCIGCHSIACNRAGPKLQDIFNRRAGTVADFKSYTQGLRTSGIVWTDETLDEFLRDPGKLVPGTWMAAIGRIDGAEDRRDIIAYLHRQDRSIDLCP
jgi:cytochrome c